MGGGVAISASIHTFDLIVELVLLQNVSFCQCNQKNVDSKNLPKSQF